MPWIADLTAGFATMAARRRLSNDEPLTLLVDSNIHTHAVTHNDAWIDTGTVLAGGKLPVSTGYAARVPVYSEQEKSREYEDICYLTGLTYLARKQYLSMFTSRELMAEQDRQPPTRFSPTGYADLSLLSRLDIQPIDDWSTDAIIHRPSRAGVSLNQFQLNRVNSSRDETFRKIWKIFGNQPKMSLDAWHLRTAHTFSLSGILTMDYSLANTFAHNKIKLVTAGITANIWTPKSLGKELGISALKPNLFGYNDDGFPVRNDLYLRNGVVRKAD